MREKKSIILKSPDLNKMQAVYIDQRTKIYIALNADPAKARNRYLERYGVKKTM